MHLTLDRTPLEGTALVRTTHQVSVGSGDLIDERGPTLGDMGLIAKGGRNEDTKLAGTSQTLYMEPCADCGAPITLVAAARPEVFRCTTCAAKVAADPAD